MVNIARTGISLGCVCTVFLLAGCPTPQVTVPTVVGLSQQAAVATIDDADLSVGEVTTEHNANLPAGIVISQTPEPGATVDEGAEVSLVVSLGPAPVAVPDVVGQPQVNAQAALFAAGFTMGTITQAFSDTVPIGRVISQSPVGGSVLTPGAPVSLVISLGVQPVEVPDVTGQTQAAATAALLGAGLTVGALTQAFSSTVAAGSVISQTPAAGTGAMPGTAVSLVISLGPAPVTVPDVVGDTQVDAQAAIVGAGLSVGAVTQAASDTVPIGSVISQNPAGGAGVSAGTAVSLVVSIGPAGVSVPTLVGTQEAAATAAIEAAGLTLGAITRVFSETDPVGLVLAQSPVAGTSVAPGTVVTLTVSGGAECIEVPNVTFVTEDGAAKLLAEAGFVLGSVSEELNAAVSTGLVVSHTPAAGACAAAGTLVDVVISLGIGPVEINNLEELQRIGNHPDYPLDGNYVLGNTINAAATETWNGGLGFDPIGGVDAPFNGRFDGQGFVITNLHINRPDEDYVGLFGKLGDFDALDQEARIGGLNLTNATVAGRDFVGVLCGYAGNGRLADCEVNGEVTARGHTGVMAGFLHMDGNDCITSGVVTGTGAPVGGFAGSISGHVRTSTSSAVVTGFSAVGGFAGGNSGVLEDCSATGNVTGENFMVGGFVGSNGDAQLIGEGILRGCFSTGEVTGAFEVGGLAGRSFNGAAVEECFSASAVTCTSFGGAGGLIGFNYLTPVRESYSLGTVANTSPWAGTGGLIGISGASTISDCYSQSAVSGADRVGGLIGDAAWGVEAGAILRCYAAGAVTSPGERGGLIGYFDTNLTPVILSSFWDINTTGQVTSNGGTGLTTAQMRTEAVFSAASWDFGNTWDIVEGVDYPFLQWENE